MIILFMMFPLFGLADAKVLSQIIHKILYVVSINDVNKDSSQEAIRYLSNE